MDSGKTNQECRCEAVYPLPCRPSHHIINDAAFLTMLNVRSAARKSAGLTEGRPTVERLGPGRPVSPAAVSGRIRGRIGWGARQAHDPEPSWPAGSGAGRGAAADLGGNRRQRRHYLRRRELRAEPALNQAICSAFSECLRAASAEEPSRRRRIRRMALPGASSVMPRRSRRSPSRTSS